MLKSMQFDETAPQSTKEQAAAEGDYEVLYIIAPHSTQHCYQLPLRIIPPTNIRIISIQNFAIISIYNVIFISLKDAAISSALSLCSRTLYVSFVILDALYHQDSHSICIFFTCVTGILGAVGRRQGDESTCQSV